MKRHSRLLALLLAAVLTLSCCPGVLAYGTASEWAKPELDRMEELGLIPESLENQESLIAPTTRLQMCEIAVQAYETYTGKEIPVEDPQPFTDTDDINVAKAYALGLATGYGNGLFGPDDVLARDQFCTFTYRFLDVLGVKLQGEAADVEYFLDIEIAMEGSTMDVTNVAAWAKVPVFSMVRFGILKGSSGRLMLKDSVTAEQSLILFCRVYEKLLSGGFVNHERMDGASGWAMAQLGAMDKAGLIPNIVLYDDLSAPITRREMCYVAVRAYFSMMGMPINETRPSPFADVSDPIVTAAYYTGLMSGYGNGLFGPDDLVTREQLYTITMNFLQASFYYRNDAPNANVKQFSDWNQVSAFAQPATRLLVDMGIVKGGDGKLNPKAYTDRQSALILFSRSYDSLGAWMDEGVIENPVAKDLVSYALKFVGYPYVYAGASPSTGFDCSGIVYYVYAKFGINLPHGATSQWNSSKGVRVSTSELMPGDLLFFSNNGGSSMFHVAIYIGNNQYLHAANTARGVVVDTISWSSGWFAKNFYGAKRYL